MSLQDESGNYWPSIGDFYFVKKKKKKKERKKEKKKKKERKKKPLERHLFLKNRDNHTCRKGTWSATGSVHRKLDDTPQHTEQTTALKPFC